MTANAVWLCLVQLGFLTTAQAEPAQMSKQPLAPEPSITPLPSTVKLLRDARQPAPAQAAKPETNAAPPTSREVRAPAPQRTRPASRNKQPKPANAMTRALAQANEDFQTQRYTQTLDILQPFEARILSEHNAGAARLQGWAARHVGDWPLAQRWFTHVASWTNQAEDMANVVRAELVQNNYAAALKQLGLMPDDDIWRELRIQTHQAYALHAFKANDFPQAIVQLEALGKLRPLDAGEQEILGWSHYKLAQYDHASGAFEQSLRLQPSQGAAEGLIFSLNAQNKLSDAYRINDALGADTPLAGLTADPVARERLLKQPPNPRVKVDENARILPTPYQPEAQPSYARTDLYIKNSETPFDQGNFRTNGLRLEGMTSSERYRLRAEARVFNAEDERQSAHTLRDVYLQGRYFSPEGHEWTLGLGSTPQGGILDPTWRGELGLGWLESEQGGRIRLARRNVEQSVLSTSGSAQPASADKPITTWGQVMREGLDLEGYSTLGSWKAEGSLGFAQLKGVGVADNRMYELYANTLHPVPSLLDGLALGPMLYATGYQKNLSAFTPGNGGYYSPEKMLRLAAMFRYQILAHDHSGINMRLDASLGWQTADEAAASLKPLAAEVQYTLSPGHNSGLAATADLSIYCKANQNWRYGLLLSGQNSPDYSSFSSQIYLMYAW